MTSPMIGFEHILNATLRMARQNFEAQFCAFLQLDDGERLRVRGVDGTGARRWQDRDFTVSAGPVAECLKYNRITRAAGGGSGEMLGLLGTKSAKDKGVYVLVPVSGQSRVLGILICGPFTSVGAKTLSLDQLRSAGALCAVLTAHWRMYEWLSSFTPQVNHELRTPLTAVQGSLGMVLGGMCGQVGGEMREMLEMAQKGCERTVRAIEEYISKQLPSKSSEFKQPDAERKPQQ